MKYLNSYKLFENKISPEDILKELSLCLSDAGLYVKIGPDPKFESNPTLAISDDDRIYCKKYPEDDMDWLYGKPIIDEFFQELNDFGLIRDKDYKVYGGGLGVNIVFNKGLNKVKL